MSYVRVFHSDGPATEKLRGPKPTVLVLGTVRGTHEDEGYLFNNMGNA